MRVIIVGAGGATRELLRGLGDIWEVVTIDPDRDRLALAEKVRDIEAIEGDGSSAVVLARAALGTADAFVAASNDDDINLEACRLAIAGGVVRVVAIAAQSERLADYRELQVPVFSPSRLTARRMEISLEPRRVTSAAFADGKAEAIEVRIAPDAQVRGKTLADLHAERWLVAAVLRHGRLIVPHGTTRLEAGDLVTLVGAAADYALIVRTFGRGGGRFPAQIGRHVAVGLATAQDLDKSVAEAAYLVRNSSAESLLVVYRDPETMRDREVADQIIALVEAVGERATGVEVRPRPVPGPAGRFLSAVTSEESVGVIVVPAPAGDRLRRRFRVTRLLREFRSSPAPVLFARGLDGYDDIVVPAPVTPRGLTAARAAIDLASYGNATVTGVAVISQVGTGGAPRETVLAAASRLREEAAALGVRVRRRVRRGSMARVLEENAGRGLVVLPMPRGIPTPFQPGVAGHLLLRTEASLLLVPDAPIA